MLSTNAFCNNINIIVHKGVVRIANTRVSYLHSFHVDPNPAFLGDADPDPDQGTKITFFQRPSVKNNFKGLYHDSRDFTNYFGVFDAKCAFFCFTSDGFTDFILLDHF